jgi:hypothetical protein
MLKNVARKAGKVLPWRHRIGPYAGIPTYLLATLAPLLAYGGKKFFGGYSQE